MSILCKTTRNVRFVLFRKNSISYIICKSSTFALIKWQGCSVLWEFPRHRPPFSIPPGSGEPWDGVRFFPGIFFSKGWGGGSYVTDLSAGTPLWTESHTHENITFPQTSYVVGNYIKSKQSIQISFPKTSVIILDDKNRIRNDGCSMTYLQRRKTSCFKNDNTQNWDGIWLTKGYTIKYTQNTS